MQFGDRLVEKITQTSNIVVGIDPNFDLMPKAILPANGELQSVTNFSNLDVSLEEYQLSMRKKVEYFVRFGKREITNER